MSNSETVFPETADIETSSHDYAQRFSGEIGAWLLQVQEKATLQLLSPYQQAKVLDVGGGHGQLTNALIQNGYQVTVVGSDNSCKTRIQSFIDQNLCSFQVGNILDLPYPNQAFDVVVSYRLLPHVQAWQKFLFELCRVARQAVIIDYPAVQSMNYIAPYLFQVKKKLEGNTRPFTCFREDELLNVCQSAGFVKGDRYPQFFLPMVLHRKLKSPKISSAMENLSRLAGLTNLLGSPVIIKLFRDN